MGKTGKIIKSNHFGILEVNKGRQQFGRHLFDKKLESLINNSGICDFLSPGDSRSPPTPAPKGQDTVAMKTGSLTSAGGADLIWSSAETTHGERQC